MNRVTLPVVLASGLIDGLNPCAFGVLLSFTAVILASVALTQDPRPQLWKADGAYVAGMFLTYLLLGLGIVAALSLFTTTHLPIRLMGLLVVALGLWVLKDVVLPCSSAIYVGILALIAREPLLARLFYLISYNIMFVAPLLALLAVVSDRRVLNRIAHVFVQRKALLKATVGVVTVVLGLVILATA